MLMYGSQVSNGLLGLCNVLVVSWVLGPAGRGDVVFLVTISQLTAQFCTCGVDQAISNFTGRNAAARPALASNALVLALALGAFGALVVGLLFAFFPGVGGELPTHLRVLALLAIPLPLLYIFLSWMVQAEYRFNVSSLAYVLIALNNVVVNGAFALLGILSVETAFAAWMLGYGISTGLLGGYVATRLAGFGRPSAALAREMLLFGLKAFAGRTFMFANYKMGHWFVGAQAGSRELGLYSVAVTWMETLYYLPQALSAALRPDLVRDEHAGAARRTAIVFRMAAIMTGAAALVMIVAAPVLCVTIFGEDFAGAVDDLRILVLGTVGVVTLRLLGSALTAQGRPLRESAGMSVAVVTMLVLNVLLVPSLGGVGAALASTIGFTAGGVAITVLFARTLSADARELVPRPADVRVLATALRRAQRGLRHLVYGRA